MRSVMQHTFSQVLARTFLDRRSIGLTVTRRLSIPVTSFRCIWMRLFQAIRSTCRCRPSPDSLRRFTPSWTTCSSTASFSLSRSVSFGTIGRNSMASRKTQATRQTSLYPRWRPPLAVTLMVLYLIISAYLLELIGYLTIPYGTGPTTSYGTNGSVIRTCKIPSPSTKVMVPTALKLCAEKTWQAPRLLHFGPALAAERPCC